MLLASASRLCGGSVELVAIDMPLARLPIVGRRASDNAVSKAYGGRKCGTHTPNALRPGRISDYVRESFELAGYILQTDVERPAGLIEVYPHPALVELAGTSIRLPYKVAKVRTYWPSANPAERRVRLFQQWSGIVALLEEEIAGVKAALSKAFRGREFGNLDSKWFCTFVPLGRCCVKCHRFTDRYGRSSEA
jgi:predicted RNase H-like nuclease